MADQPLRKKFIEFIESQQMFFVATAAPDGRVNVSPKGLSSLRVMSGNRIVWLNLSGSGNETAAHVQECNRITMMFCAFEGPALILRVYGAARIVHPRDADWSKLVGLFPPMAGSRQVFDVTVESAKASCGTGVPLYAFKGQRSELVPYFEELGDDGIKAYWERKNQQSIDGKPTNILE